MTRYPCELPDVEGIDYLLLEVHISGRGDLDLFLALAEAIIPNNSKGFLRSLVLLL